VRLLVISQYFWPEDFRVNELVAELCSRGHEITVLTGKPNYPDGEVYPEFVRNPAAFTSYAGARVVRVPMLARGKGRARLLLNYLSFALSATLFGMLRLAKARFDAMFVFEPSPVTVGLPAVSLRAIRGWPLVFWVLDQWPESLAAVGAIRSKPVLRLVGRLVRFIYRRCDVILSPSRLLMSCVESYCRPGQRIEYFPNWVEGTYSADRPTAAPEVPERADSFSIMFAGNVGEAQDFPTILDAAERLTEHADIRWLIVGDGRAAPWVRREIARRQLVERVIMLGRHPQERMPSFFNHADALLVSLRRDPIFALTAPGKIQSYLAYGRPVLAMLDGEGANVVDRARAGFASPAGDATRLAENVLRLAALPPEERLTMGRRGAEFAQREFSRDVLICSLEKWLDELRGRVEPTGAR